MGNETKIRRKELDKKEFCPINSMISEDLMRTELRLLEKQYQMCIQNIAKHLRWSFS